MRKQIDIVIPAYDEEANIKPLYSELIRVLPNNYEYNFIFVDDGSKDGTFLELCQLSSDDPRVKYISLSRNFGHQVALKAGINHSEGDAVISMDCDLQHPVNLIPQMIQMWEQGHDVVFTVRKNVGIPFVKKIFSEYFYKIVNIFSDVPIVDGAADFRLIDKSVADEIKTIKDSSLFLRGLISWIGFNQTSISYIPNSRMNGRSKYSVKKLVNFAVDGITSSSIKPLRISTFLGFLVSSISGIYGIYTLMIHYLDSDIVTGWTSLIITVLFLGGIQLIMLGIIGEYIGKIFIQTKSRPYYVIKKKKV